MNVTAEAYKESKKLLEYISTPAGFVASAIDTDNYHRIFARDGVIATIAALLTEDKKLIKTGKQTLLTLAKYQDETGRIVSNVSPDGKRVSFGIQVGRIDASAWFIIGVGQYVKRTKDIAFAKKMHPYIKKTIQYLSAIEMNGRGFLYIPFGGDWADEYLNHGYVLFDQLLYLQAQRDFVYINKILKYKYKDIERKSKFLEKQIIVNFIPKLTDVDDPAFYQRSEAFEKLHQGFKKPYALAYFVQGDMGEYFDVFANSLLLILTKLPDTFKKEFLKYSLNLLNKQKISLIPAFSPVIKKNHEKNQHHRWKMLKFSYVFRQKNKPYHYHNGGLWPLVQGFFIAALYCEGKNKEAKKITEDFADILAKNKYKFVEYYDGKNGKPNGTEFLGFSASAYIFAYLTSFDNKKIFI